MTTRFYNTVTEQLEGPLWKGGYKVDGQPGTPPEGCIEVEIIRQAHPDITTGQVASPSEGLNGTVYTYGWTVRDKTAAEIRAEIPPITDIQMRAWLFSRGKLDTLRSKINSITDSAQRFMAQTRFDRSGSIRRTDSLTVWAGQQLGMTEEDMDTAFIEAAAIEF